MKTVALLLAASLVAGSSAVADTTRAEPLTLTRTIVKDGFGKVHRYCDQQSRCWTEGYRNPLIETYAFAAPPWYRKPVVTAAHDRAKTASVRTAQKKSPREAYAKAR